MAGCPHEKAERIDARENVAGTAEADSRKALDVARKLSQQIRAAEERINELEAETEAYRQKAS